MNRDVAVDVGPDGTVRPRGLTKHELLGTLDAHPDAAMFFVEPPSYPRAELTKAQVVAYVEAQPEGSTFTFGPPPRGPRVASEALSDAYLD